MSYTISTDFEYIGQIDRHFNANLIVTAVNACQKVNPDNPQAVVEAIGEMYEALKDIKNYATENQLILTVEQKIIKAKCYQTLAKAEGRNAS